MNNGEGFTLKHIPPERQQELLENIKRYIREVYLNKNLSLIRRVYNKDHFRRLLRARDLEELIYEKQVMRKNHDTYENIEEFLTIPEFGFTEKELWNMNLDRIAIKTYQNLEKEGFYKTSCRRRGY